MVIKKLDVLSPPVTFYYKGVLSHPSFVSGIISIIAFIIIMFFAVYYSLFVIMRKNPKTYYFSSFTNDAGVFPINSSSFFHFISMSEDSDNPTDKGVNFENFRILGFDIYYYYAYINGSINNFDHWLYGYCNNDSDIDGISNLINQQYFEKSACIRKYFSQKDQKYYDTGNINFKWPEMAHGTYNKNKTYYSVVLEKCREDTIDLVLGKGHHCKNDTELDEILSHHGVVHFNFIDNYIDALNYSYPVTKYFYRVENSLDKDHYTINHLNFNPSLVKTNYGLFWDRYSQETSYSYERNDAFTYELGEEKIYMGYYLWLNNKLFYSERIYQRVQDVLSNIGGIFQAIFLAASLVNSLYNKYIVLIDTEKLLSSSVEKEKDYKPKNAKFEKAKKVLKNKTSDMDGDKSNNTLKNINEKHNLYKSKSNKLINSNKEKDNLKSDYYNFKTDYKNINNNYNKEENKIEKEKNNDDNKNKIENYKEKNFWNYFCYKISKGKKNNSFRIYESFRTKIISEEHLIRNYLNIYNLLKVSKKKLLSRRNSYHLKDLINLV
jgi:hypothetical protein